MQSNRGVKNSLQQTGMAKAGNLTEVLKKTSANKDSKDRQLSWASKTDFSKQ